MGSERNSRKRRSSPSTSLEDDENKVRKLKKRDEKQKKTRKDDDQERKKRKRDKKSGEHSDFREREGKEKRERHKHKKKRAVKEGFKEISDQDYFSKNNEFSTWLKERGIYFSDLSSEEARDLFSSFIKAWNKQKLQPWYYDGIASAPRTAYDWKIKHDKWRELPLALA
ncbi:protein PXR1 [Phalaenopsis equestris]|uniref:protein PXR1 n=1 Tax=Phalaenopsis equestris TaxID=78828 RepID=UPI0009E29131|nr:protein PXR1 [Phalaenopsis equestris]